MENIDYVDGPRLGVGANVSQRFYLFPRFPFSVTSTVEFASRLKQDAVGDFLQRESLPGFVLDFDEMMSGQLFGHFKTYHVQIDG